MLLYDRMLSARERASVEKYLATKYAHIKRVPLPAEVDDATRLVRVADPPPMQMFVPGFEVRQLPVELKNINNVLYRPDGKLVALAYNGNIYLLSDTDGDGLEDKAAVVLGEQRAASRADRHGADAARPGSRAACSSRPRASRAAGGYRRRRSADQEQIVAAGWTELPHGVDALGVAVDPRDGSVYFGLGSQDYTDAYGVGSKQAVPYSLDSERGTIMRVAPDFKSRSVVATGIRFQRGDPLQQARATCSAPTRKGRPGCRTATRSTSCCTSRRAGTTAFRRGIRSILPNVIDEPSTFDYRPQHQSHLRAELQRSGDGRRDVRARLVAVAMRW